MHIFPCITFLSLFHTIGNKEFSLISDRGRNLKSIWVPISGQIAQQQKVETIANNIANANTTGFKKDQLAFQEHLSALTGKMDDIDIPNKEWAPKDFYHSYGAENSFVKVKGTYTVHEQGQLQPTNNNLDVGLYGKGFIEVQGPNGIRYTRNGSLTQNSDGHLVTEQGFKVLSKIQEAPELSDESSIESRYIKLPNSNISISKDGSIYNTEGKINQLSIVEFNDIQALNKEGTSLFVNSVDGNIKREQISTTVNQGFVEGSNVNAVSEMSELIQAHRHFENIQKAINAYDNINTRAVNDIAKF
jgi:flagellar basal-body rod protein FlgG